MSGEIKSRLSKLTGEELLRRLQAVRWSRSDFARLTGLSRQSVDDYVTGKRDGKIPAIVELALQFVELHPVELQARPEVQTPYRQTPARKEAAWEMLDRGVPPPPHRLIRGTAE